MCTSNLGIAMIPIDQKHVLDSSVYFETIGTIQPLGTFSI